VEGAGSTDVTVGIEEQGEGKRSGRRGGVTGRGGERERGRGADGKRRKSDKKEKSRFLVVGGMRVVREEHVDEEADQDPFNSFALRALPNPAHMIPRTHLGGGKRLGEAFGIGGGEAIEGVVTMQGYRGVCNQSPLGPCENSPTNLPTNLGVAQVPLGKVQGPTPGGGGGGTTTRWLYTAPLRGSVTHSPSPPPPPPPRAAAGGMAAAGKDEEPEEEERGADIAARERERDAVFTSMSGCSTNDAISREQVRCMCVFVCERDRESVSV
jgi:hypothetical protein